MSWCETNPEGLLSVSAGLSQALWLLKILVSHKPAEGGKGAWATPWKPSFHRKKNKGVTRGDSSSLKGIPSCSSQSGNVSFNLFNQRVFKTLPICSHQCHSTGKISGPPSSEFPFTTSKICRVQYSSHIFPPWSCFLGAAFFPSHSPTQQFLCPFSVVLPMLVHFSHGSCPFQLSQPTYSSKSKATKPQKNTGVWKRKPLLKQFVSQSFQSHLISGAFDTSLSSAEGAKCVRREREKKEQKNNLL